MLYTFVRNKFVKGFDSEISYIEARITNQNHKFLGIEDQINITCLLIKVQHINMTCHSVPSRDRIFSSTK